MSEILFFILGLIAAKVTIWQTGLLTFIFGSTTETPDYAIAALSFAATLIFFGLWLAGRDHKKKKTIDSLLD